MIRITKEQKNKLDSAGLLRSNPNDRNYVVVNKEHTGRHKHYYVAEEYKILKFLGFISKEQKKEYYKNKAEEDRNNKRNQK